MDCTVHSCQQAQDESQKEQQERALNSEFSFLSFKTTEVRSLSAPNPFKKNSPVGRAKNLQWLGHDLRVVLHLVRTLLELAGVVINLKRLCALLVVHLLLVPAR
jgi:hypothetical protein